MTDILSAPSVDNRASGRLRDRVVVVTGAGQGIGSAAARRMASEGAVIAAVDRYAPGASRTTDEIVTAGGRAKAFVADLMSYDEATSVLGAVHAAFGRIDVLVNNAGGATQLKPFQDWSPQELVDEINRSLLPTLWCCRAVLPGMLERGFGRIVNVGAESVRNGLWDRAPYSVGKGGVHALTTSIARETAGLGVTCNCCAPASTDTAPGRLVARGDRVIPPEEVEHRKGLRTRMIGTIPLGRSATPEEQAAMIAFLASDDASFITGQVISVNGGSSML
jgi:NAD(P)-dependent dehydrogenase (short-subunit alcohol dehydrogenase family)